MPETASVDLPAGCVADSARVMCYARTRAEYAKVVSSAKVNGKWMLEGEGSRKYVSWVSLDTGIDYQVMCPSPEEEEQFAHCE